MTDAALLPPRVLARRFESQLLLDRGLLDPIEVVGRITAVQAQDARGSLLAVRARSRGLTSADVDRCLTDERSLVVGWLNRGTLHLVRSEDHAWLHALTAPRQLPARAPSQRPRLLRQRLRRSATRRPSRSPIRSSMRWPRRCRCSPIAPHA